MDFCICATHLQLMQFVFHHTILRVVVSHGELFEQVLAEYICTNRLFVVLRSQPVMFIIYFACLVLNIYKTAKIPL